MTPSEAAKLIASELPRLFFLPTEEAEVEIEKLLTPAKGNARWFGFKNCDGVYQNASDIWELNHDEVFYCTRGNYREPSFYNRKSLLEEESLEEITEAEAKERLS